MSSASPIDSEPIAIVIPRSSRSRFRTQRDFWSPSARNPQSQLPRNSNFLQLGMIISLARNPHRKCPAVNFDLRPCCISPGTSDKDLASSRSYWLVSVRRRYWSPQRRRWFCQNLL